MNDKKFKKPMVAAIILQSIALVIGIAVYFAQGVLGTMQRLGTGQMVFPSALESLVIALLLHIICLLVMRTYEGESRNSIATLMIVAYCVVHILSTYLGLVSNVFASRQGAAYVAAKGMLTSYINICTSPLTFISLALALVAIGRYGISYKAGAEE